MLCQMAQAGSVPIHAGHGGHWYDPARDGEGWVLEILESDSALLYWFTYDEDGGQRWMTAVGSIVSDDSGERIDFPQLVVTRGGRFGPDFDPDDVEREAVGSATLRFSGCDAGEFVYEAFGQNQTIPIQRLAYTMGVWCESLNGVPGRDASAEAGQSGSWFDPAHDGEGYTLQWMSPDQALLTWYSYDAEGHQYWMLGVGQLVDGHLHFPDLHSTRGARFGEAFDPADVERFAWGQLTLTLGCDAGQADYDSALTGFGAGALDLKRLTRLHDIACPWQRPKLTDLYDISVTPIPIAPNMPMEPNLIQVQSITDDGTVFGVVGRENGHQVVRFVPGASEWEALPNDNLYDPIFVPSDGSFIVATESVSDMPSTPVIWREDAGWQPLGNLLFENSVVTGSSLDRRYLAGEGRNSDGRDFPWLWSAETGQVQLAISDDIPAGRPHAVSNDGRIVTGISLRFINGFPRARAIRWVDGGPPEQLYDIGGAELGLSSKCNADCSLIFGSDQVSVDFEHPHARQAWYWRAPGVSGYLGKVEGASFSVINPYWIGDVTDDGTLVGGNYTILPGLGEAFVWTQHTGMVSLRPLLDELGLEPWSARAAVSVSSTGHLILLRGEQSNGGGLDGRAAVLHLKPKSSTDDIHSTE
jgi:hypothetical protein